MHQRESTSVRAPSARVPAWLCRTAGLPALLVLSCVAPRPGAQPGAPVAPQVAPVTPLAAARPQNAPHRSPVLHLRRGINLGNGLDAPSEGEWGVVLDERHFAMAAEAGLDHVRLPVRFSAHAAETAPFAIEPAFLDRVDWALAQAQAHGLSVVLDMHHYNELCDAPDAEEARFVAMWRQLAARYHDRGSWLVYELLNEPTKALTSLRWNRLAARTITAVRAIDPARVIIIDAGYWAASKELHVLELPEDDPNLVASFHMYEPILFTHQGAPYMEPEFRTQGVVFPGPPPVPVQPVEAARRKKWVATWFAAYNSMPGETNPSGQRTIDEHMAFVDRYVARTGRQLYMGEFAVIDNADPASRERWLRAVRTEAERRGIAWAYWDDGGRNRAMDVKAGTWVSYIRKALLELQP